MRRFRLISWLTVGWVIGSFFIATAIASNGRSWDDSYEIGRAASSIYWPTVIVGLLVLLPIWWFTRRPKPRCPRCFLELDPRMTWCPRCGYYPGLPIYPGQVPYPGRASFGQPPAPPGAPDSDPPNPSGGAPSA